MELLKKKRKLYLQEEGCNCSRKQKYGIEKEKNSKIYKVIIEPESNSYNHHYWQTSNNYQESRKWF